jgi:ABC-type Fe3+/spermidine/putrescine transport system ATPase subunit
MKSGHAIRIESVRKNYGALAALDGLSLNIKAGEFTVLLGPSGSGKSTLIRSLAGIEKLDSGSIFFGDREVNRGPLNVAPEKRDLAMVFQDYALWPHLSALENVGYAMKRRKLSPDDSLKKVRAALSRVGLASKEANYPHQLSGGEQQRVALARAIVADPALLLFDEPLSNLDADLRERLRIEISTLTREIGASALYITHDQSEAFALADQIGVINHGVIEQIDSPEIIYEKPATRFVATFTGTAGIFKGRVKSISAKRCVISLGKDSLTARHTVPLEVGQEVDLLVRPAATSFTQNDNEPISSTIIDIAYRGRGYEHAIETKYGSLTGVFDTISHSRGQKMEVSIDPDKCIAFPRQLPDLTK